MNNAASTITADAAQLGQLSQCFANQREAHRRAPWPSWHERAARLQTLRHVLQTHADDICQAINEDFGCRPPAETRLLELFPALGAIKHALGHGRRWMRPKRQWASFWFLPARTRLIAQPLGVVGIVVPWNYPLYLAVGPMVDALAAGNHVLVKMSEYTPRFAQLFAVFIEAAFPAGEVRIISGDVDVARAFVALPFDHLLFTGSTEVGRAVMRAAAANLTPVTLELGGKSPAIIGPGARFAQAVQRIAYGKFVNAGQTCIAPDYVLLPRARVDEFIAIAQRTWTRMYPDGAGSGHYASIISAAQHQRLCQWRDQAVELGAEAHALAEPAADATRILPPTVLTDVPAGAQVMREEIFGPLLPLVPYDDFEMALQYVQARPQPLALYLFETNRRRVKQVLQATTAGGVSVNDTLYHIAQHHLPFGGVGPSGMGAYHGKEGFHTFSKMKPVFKQSRCNGVGLLNPPYGKRFAQMMKLLLRR